MRRLRRTLSAAGIVLVLGTTACGLTPDQARYIQAHSPRAATSSCAGSPVDPIVRREWHGTWAEEWALAIVWRESRCDPGARNRSGAVGLFQLVGHDDMLAAACPSFPPSVSGTDATCNARAARFLYDAAGRSPWGG